MEETLGTVTSHYARHGELTARILDALTAAGKDTGALDLEDLAPLDQCHLRGHQATRELAAEAGLAPGQRLLDIGSGIGGPARMLAQEHGVEVTAVDLTEAFCRTAAELSTLIAEAPAPAFVCADATRLPFPDDRYDVVWTQHAAMNIPDKTGLYGECLRVCRPGGRFLVYDVVEGPAGDPHFPVPWAASPHGSFLVDAPELRRLVMAAGFCELAFRDLTAAALAWNRERQARITDAEAQPTLGPHLLMGPEFPQMIANVGRGLEEGRLGLVMGLYEKPA